MHLKCIFPSSCQKVTHYLTLACKNVYSFLKIQMLYSLSIKLKSSYPKPLKHSNKKVKIE